MKCKYSILLASTGLAAFLWAPSGALAQSAPTLGSAETFAILGASTVTCAATGGVITGDVGVSPGTSITGFPAGCTVTGGALHPGDGVAIQAHADAVFANTALAALPCGDGADFNHGDVFELGGQSLLSGVHCFPSSATLNGTLDLLGNGPWLLRIGSTLVTGATLPAFVTVNGLAADCNTLDLFWQVGSSATINGADTQFVGNILAVASIGLGSGASLDGRALALTAAVTLDGGNTVSVCGTGGSTPPPFPPGCRVKVVCHDYHDKDCDHHDKHGDRCDKDCDGHHDKDGDKDKDGDGHHAGRTRTAARRVITVTVADLRRLDPRGRGPCRASGWGSSTWL